MVALPPLVIPIMEPALAALGPRILGGGWRGCGPHSGCFRDGQGLPIASETQSISQCLCPEIPGLVRRAVKAELREFPRYEARLTAHLRHGDDVLCDLAVRDISKDGARIARIGPRMAGDPVSLAFPGTDAIASEVERDAEDDFSV